MPIKTSKAAYLKDGLFHLLTLIWFLWGEFKSLANNFDLADAIDKPIPCGVDTALLSLARIAEIKKHCEEKDGVWYIPYETWSEERFWFDFLGVLVSINFAVYGLGFVIFSMWCYWDISREAEDEDVHAAETRRAGRAKHADTGRSFFIVFSAFLAINFMILHGTTLNKLRAHGAWHGSNEYERAQAMAAQVKDDNAAALAEEGPEASFDLSGFWTLEIPEEGIPYYLGHWVKASTIFASMNILRGVFFSIVSFIASDLNVINLAIAAPPTAFVIALTCLPYLLSLYTFHVVQRVFAMDFNFGFESDMQTVFFGGIIVGTNGMIFSNFQQVMGMMVVADAQEREKVEALYQQNKEPGLFESFFYQSLKAQLKVQAPIFVVKYLVFLVVGIPCLQIPLSKHDIEDPAFHSILVLWAIGLFVFGIFSILRFKYPPEEESDAPPTSV